MTFLIFWKNTYDFLLFQVKKWIVDHCSSLLVWKCQPWPKISVRTSIPWSTWTRTPCVNYSPPILNHRTIQDEEFPEEKKTYSHFPTFFLIPRSYSFRISCLALSLYTKAFFILKYNNVMTNVIKSSKWSKRLTLIFI